VHDLAVLVVHTEPPRLFAPWTPWTPEPHHRDITVALSPILDLHRDIAPSPCTDAPRRSASTPPTSSFALMFVPRLSPLCRQAPTRSGQSYCNALSCRPPQPCQDDEPRTRHCRLRPSLPLPPFTKQSTTTNPPLPHLVCDADEHHQAMLSSLRPAVEAEIINIL